MRRSRTPREDNPELNGLVGELSLASEAFRRLWAHHDVQSALSGDARFFHPVVGAVNLRYQTFTVDGADRQTLMVVHTAPGSRDAQALARLVCRRQRQPGLRPG